MYAVLVILYVGISFVQVNRQTFIKPTRCEYNGKKFDSIAEKDFYRYLVGNLTGCTILRPCEVRLSGKARAWKCDFGVIAGSATASDRLTRLRNLLKGEEREDKTHVLYIEYKGTTDLTTGLARLDKNFVSRINHLSRYEPSILATTVCIGKGSGAVVTYCTNNQYCVMPVHTEEFFKGLVKEIFTHG